jgi:hypothetical protein
MTALSRRGFLGAFLAGAGVLMLPIRPVQGGERNADPSDSSGGSPYGSGIYGSGTYGG